MTRENLQEQACWLLLTFESKLSKRIINEVIAIWCQQLGRTLQEFFAASQQEWSDTCQLQAKAIEKLEQVRRKLPEQLTFAKQLVHDHISMLTILDDNYPRVLKSALAANQRPPVLFYVGDVEILELPAIAIIGSRHASEESLAFTREVAQYLAEQGANVISGNARGVDRAAFEGATNTYGCGCTTVVLPHGIRKLSHIQLRELQPKIEAGNVLLLSQFHPDATWMVSRAMERNNVVTALAQVVIVAESNMQGGTWAGANGALKQHRPLYVRQTDGHASLPGNKALIELGGRPLLWSKEVSTQENAVLGEVLSPLLEESKMLYYGQRSIRALTNQLPHILKEQWNEFQIIIPADWAGSGEGCHYAQRETSMGLAA